MSENADGLAQRAYYYGFKLSFLVFFVSSITLWTKRWMRHLMVVHYLKIHHLILLLESLLVSKLLTYLQLLIENIIKNWFLFSMHISCFECTCTQEGSRSWELAKISLRCSWEPLLNFFKSWFMLSMHISCFECTCTQEGSRSWELAESSLRCIWEPRLNFLGSL